MDVTLPITLERRLLTDTGAWWFDAIGRIRTGASVGQATAETDTIFQSFMKDYKNAEIQRKHWNHMELTPAAQGLDRLRSRFSMPLYALTLVAGIVLLIACANLGNLLLARGAA